MSAPRVSLVVPSYNSAAYVDATMTSLLDQTFTDTEVVVSDHSSTDGTWERLQAYRDDPRVRLVRTPSGGGAQRNWDEVTALATGELLKLVCGDDLLAPTAVADQVAAMDAAPSAVLVASRRDVVDAAARPVLRDRGLGPLSGLVDGRAAVRATVRAGTNLLGEPMCVLFRRSALLEAGGWDGRRGYLIDEATYARCLLLGDLVALPRTVGAFRISTAQWSVALAGDQARQAIGFHHDLAAEHPGLLSGSDLLLGDTRAQAMAVARRLAYVWLQRRMGDDPEQT